MLFYKISTWWKHLRGIEFIAINVTRVSWGEEIDTLFSTGSFWKPLSIAYCHLLVLFFYLMSFVSCFVSCVCWCWPCFVCVGFTIWNIQWMWSLYVHEWCGYVLRGLLSCYNSLICRKCWLSPLHSCWLDIIFKCPITMSVFTLLPRWTGCAKCRGVGWFFMYVSFPEKIRIYMGILGRTNMKHAST